MTHEDECGEPHVLVLPSWYPSRESPLGGIFFREQASALRRAGVEVGVAYPHLRSLRTLLDGSWARNRFQLTAATEGGIPTVRIHGWNVPSTRLRGRLFVRLARRAVDAYVTRFGRPDLLHAHSALWGGVAARRLGRGIPYVLTEHSSAFARGLLEPWQLTAVAEACEGASRVVTVSRALADELASRVGMSDATVVPNLVDTDFFTLPPEPRAAPPFVVLTVCTLRPNKRIDVLLRAFAAAFGEDEETRLVVGGDGTSRGDLQRLAEELGIADRVEFPGRLSRAKVRAEMWRANLYVLSSQVETFGIALVEAMATGLPVVATRSGGPEEVVFEDAGWLVEPGSVEALAAALQRARRQQPHLRQGAADIRRKTTEAYGYEAVTGRLREVYRSVVGEADHDG